MYFAFGILYGPQCDGTTRCHGDAASAVNIMLHAKLTRSGAPGSARWDIFAASDAPALAQFMRKYKNVPDGDYNPIHLRNIYLNAQDLLVLRDEYGVVPFTIQQRVGDAVFIPAGCPHQVRQTVLPGTAHSSLGRCQTTPTASKLPATFLPQKVLR